MDTTNLAIELHSSVKNNQLFKRLSNLTITKMGIFKYGILNEAVPDKIKENDFDYLESKIPFLYGLFADWIEMESKRIISTASGEESRKISEILGVGVGLYYSTELFGINPSDFKRIPPPNTKGGKYLDFKFTTNNVQYEVETKGTVYHENLNSFIKDIQDKKKDSNTTGCKYGAVTLANKIKDKQPSKIVVCDDFDNSVTNAANSIIDYFEYYNLFLSFILDSTYYNRLLSKINKGKLKKNSIKTKMIKKEYIFDNTKYIGQCFDRRLFLDFIAEHYQKNMKINTLFKLLTSGMGKQKIFLGIDPQILIFLNNLDLVGINTYTKKPVFVEGKHRKLVRDTDGIIFVVSVEGEDEQIENNLSEEEVKQRLSYIIGSFNNEPHQCGAPCRSKDKEGKPCEKMTFRDYCHFHRD